VGKEEEVSWDFVRWEVEMGAYLVISNLTIQSFFGRELVHVELHGNLDIFLQLVRIDVV